jgi:hypothetical protein
MRTIYIRHDVGLYEVPISTEGIIKKIVHYANGDDLKGKEVDFEVLPNLVKNKIQQELNEP